MSTSRPAGSPCPSTPAPIAWPTRCGRWPTPHVDIDDIGLRRPTLDEVFLALTGRPTTDDDAHADDDDDAAAAA